MFIDRVKIKVQGGNGGRGCCSFRKEKYVPKGGPDGGDGGTGGDVILRGSHDVQNLVALYYMPHYEGEDGKHGKGKDLHGARGKARIVTVPCGTVVRDLLTGEQLVDIDRDGQEFVAACGGRGGRGNARFVTSTCRVPRLCENGEDGEERQLELELKLVADVGLVGFPNAGKSTLLSAVSDAHPKTAAYPFTTLHPAIGMVEFPDFFRFSIADIPGLVEGAHDNVGLGHDFLRHIERARVLVYVLDMEGTDDRDPLDDFETLRNELELYKKDLLRRPALIAANKMDGARARENLARLLAVAPLTVVPVCAVLRENTAELVQKMRELLPIQPVPAALSLST